MAIVLARRGTSNGLRNFCLADWFGRLEEAAELRPYVLEVKRPTTRPEAGSRFRDRANMDGAKPKRSGGCKKWQWFLGLGIEEQCASGDTQRFPILAGSQTDQIESGTSTLRV